MNNKASNGGYKNGGLNGKIKYCTYCGSPINETAKFCKNCGGKIDFLNHNSPQNQTHNNPQPPIIINNTNTNINHYGNAKNKWISLILCLFLGVLGAHKFYEGKIAMGVFYILTVGFFGIGVFIDFFVILFKPTVYYV